MSPDKQMLSVQEAAAILGVNIKTVYQAIKAGTIPCHRLGRVIRIPTRVIESMTMQDRAVPSEQGHDGKA